MRLDIENDNFLHLQIFHRFMLECKNPRRQSFSFIPEFLYFERKKLLRCMILMQELWQKGVQKFYNSNTDATKIFLLRFRVEKWLLKIITRFFYNFPILSWLMQVSYKKRYKITFLFTSYTWHIFLKQYICESPCNFFALLIIFQMMGSIFQSELPFLSYKIFECSDFRYLLVI